MRAETKAYASAKRPAAVQRFKRPRTHTGGSGLAAYEAAKNDWDAGHPDADYRTRDAAMQQMARSMGV